MNESSSNYNLRWNEFSKNVTNSFGILQKEEELCDITLISDDKIPMKAHKLVLSACSEFFSDLFKSEPFKSSFSHPNSLLFLGGIESKMLEIILEYVYFGEAQIRSEDFDMFLERAKKLKIFGLTEDTFSSLELHKPKELLVPKVEMERESNGVYDAVEATDESMDINEESQSNDNDDDGIEVLIEELVNRETSITECLDLSLKKEAEGDDTVVESCPDNIEDYLENARQLNIEDNDNNATLEEESSERILEETSEVDETVESHVVQSKESDNSSSSKQFECTLCTKSYNIKGSLYMHMVHKHGKESFTSWSRNQGKDAIANSVPTLEPKEAENKTSENKSTKTQRSNKIVVTSQEEAEEVLKKMGRKVNGEFKCTFCKARKKHMSTLKYHMETHLEGLQYNCDKCDQVIKSRISLYQHQRLKH